LKICMVIWRLPVVIGFLWGWLAGPLSAAEFDLAGGDDLIGSPGHIVTIYEDTLIDIARAHQLGYEEIRLANPGVDVWIPGEGTEVQLPTQFILPNSQRVGIVINIAEYRMYYYFEAGGNEWVRTFPISIGRMDWGTPLGRASITKKVTNPSWYPPQSIRDEWAADGRDLQAHVPPGPDNPLGEYAMRLSIPGYLIHGTNRPAGVGMRVTHGCIRMFPEDIEWLFPQVPVNTPVQIVNQPIKLGWIGDDLYLEVHPPLEEGGASEESANGTIVVQNSDEDTAAVDKRSMTDITEIYIQATRERAAIVDWELINTVYEKRLGIPVKVGVADERMPMEANPVQADLQPGG
jgi:L,D-transpeptidase ErfK/SrfK